MGRLNAKARRAKGASNLRFVEPSVRRTFGSNNVLLSKTWYNSAPLHSGA
jgi:hypothetical protein